MKKGGVVWCALVWLLYSLGLPPLAESCSCPPDNSPGSRPDAIRGSFCGSQNIYQGRVIEATCNCIPDEGMEMNQTSTLLNCQHYRLQFTQSIINATIVDQGRCDYPRYTYTEGSYTSLCSTLANSLMTWGLVVEGPELPGGGGGGEGSLRNLTTPSYQDCNFACPFNEVTRKLPCTYIVRVTRVFKGNISEEDYLEVMGPDTQNTCGSPSLRLQISTEYLVGVGSVCGPFNNWSEFSTFSNDEIQLLQRLSTGEEAVDCGAWQLLPSSILLTILTLLTIST